MTRILRTLGFFSIVLIMCCCFTATTHAELKIGYIRSQYLFQKYEPYKEAEKQLEEFHKKELFILNEEEIQLYLILENMELDH